MFQAFGLGRVNLHQAHGGVRAGDGGRVRRGIAPIGPDVLPPADTDHEPPLTHSSEMTGGNRDLSFDVPCNLLSRTAPPSGRP